MSTTDRRKSLTPGQPETQSSDIASFIEKVNALGPTAAAGPRGRLLFALDATMSRQPTWDLACQLQAEMFAAVADQPLEVQLLYFRGVGECRASKWVRDAKALAGLMRGISVRGGNTQSGKVLAHARAEHSRQKINALVYVGDAMEEGVDDLAQKAGRLGLHGVPVFAFQEGHDAVAETAFREIARLSKGAWFRFDRNAAATLSKLLSAVAVFASGGLPALEARGRAEDRLMIEHLKKAGGRG